MRKQVIVYSHGFGVRKDDRGLFTDIADSMPEVKHVLLDYNLIDEQANTLTVNPLQGQVKKLRDKLDEIDSDAIVDVIAHSQGCLVVALAKPQNIRKIICIAPPDNADAEHLIDYFGNREGSVIELEGNSRIPRRDGSTTIIPAAYWQSLDGLKVIRLYNRLPKLSKVKFIIANEDEVLGMTNFDATDERIDLVQISGNHDFTGKDRQPLNDFIRAELIND